MARGKHIVVDERFCKASLDKVRAKLKENGHNGSYREATELIQQMLEDRISMLAEDMDAELRAGVQLLKKNLRDMQ